MTKKKSKVTVTLPMVAGWLTSFSMVLTAVLPVLPASTPAIVRELLAVAAVAIAATLQSWRQPPSGDAT